MHKITGVEPEKRHRRIASPNHKTMYLTTQSTGSIVMSQHLHLGHKTQLKPFVGPTCRVVYQLAPIDGPYHGSTYVRTRVRTIGTYGQYHGTVLHTPRNASSKKHNPQVNGQQQPRNPRRQPRNPPRKPRNSTREPRNPPREPPDPKLDDVSCKSSNRVSMLLADFITRYGGIHFVSHIISATCIAWICCLSVV